MNESERARKRNQLADLLSTWLTESEEGSTEYEALARELQNGGDHLTLLARREHQIDALLASAATEQKRYRAAEAECERLVRLIQEAHAYCLIFAGTPEFDRLRGMLVRAVEPDNQENVVLP